MRTLYKFSVLDACFLSDICKNIEKIAEFVPQEKQVILVCRNILPFTCNMFKKLVPYEVNMTIPSSSTWWIQVPFGLLLECFLYYYKLIIV